MRIIAINGSRRKKGNTGILLEAIMEPAQSAGIETEQVFLGDYRIEACTGCEACSSSWDCVIRDDFFDLVEMMDLADGVLLGSPTYWYTVTSDMKRFLDRCYSLIQFPHNRQQWISKYQEGGKICISAAVCEQAEVSMMGNTLTLLSDFAKDIGFELLAALPALHCFEAGSIKAQGDILQRAEQAGAAMVSQLRQKQKEALSL